jgi:hypothetical protein
MRSIDFGRPMSPPRGGMVGRGVSILKQFTDRARAAAAGFRHHLVKPAEAGEFITMIAGLKLR